MPSTGLLSLYLVRISFLKNKKTFVLTLNKPSTSVSMYYLYDDVSYRFTILFFLQRNQNDIILLTKFLRPLVSSLNGSHDRSSKGIFFQTGYPSDGRTSWTADLIFELSRMLATDLT